MFVGNYIYCCVYLYIAYTNKLLTSIQALYRRDPKIWGLNIKYYSKFLRRSSNSNKGTVIYGYKIVQM